MLDQIKETTDFLIQQIRNYKSPETGIILGTGLGGLVDAIDIDVQIDYEEIPNFPVSTIESHKGKLIFGEICGKQVVVMQGRFHYYEGYSLSQVAFPVRVFKLLGIKTLLVSNAAGGLNPNFSKGDIMIISDHINQFPGNPLIGKNLDEIGARFPDMYEPYDKTLISKAEKLASKLNIKTKKGIYIGLPGPMLETPAEYNYLRVIGGDAVGMSTIPEIIAAKHADLACFACSVITDICYGEIKPVNFKNILETASNTEPDLTILFKELINQL
ncbi:MAG: purine-nucleoside phosphorylase [Flavobacteriales bacterium]|nr:purine-nucleoside phosphorylase [Flavobacteriales bacterium]|tara:strand:- start:7128 stop:7943 length:816 start_codon:yes stop_codon:yes gene_type:complete